MYLCKYKYYKIRFRTDEPDCSNILRIKNHDWTRTVYGKHEEDVPTDALPPLRKKITLTHYFDASLMHDALSSKAMTGVCTFYNKTLIDWYCNRTFTKSITMTVLVLVVIAI